MNSNWGSESRPTRIDSAIRAQSERLLLDAEIWKFSSFGWIDADTEDPQFSGHARWQVDPPADFSSQIFNARVGRNGVTPSNIEEWKKILAVSGTDFEGLMKASRMSIGLFLVQVDADKEADFPDEEFSDLHRMSALIYLATASERLREFFIAAAFRVSQKEYDQRPPFGKCSRRWFATPFLEVSAAFPSSDDGVLFDCSNKLMAFVAEVRALREARNNLVHELATAIGFQERQRLSSDCELGDIGKYSFEEFKKLQEDMKNARMLAISKAVAQFKGWYLLLMCMSNEAFIFENARRGSGGPIG